MLQEKWFTSSPSVLILQHTTFSLHQLSSTALPWHFGLCEEAFLLVVACIPILERFVTILTNCSGGDANGNAFHTLFSDPRPLRGEYLPGMPDDEFAAIAGL